VDIDKFKNLEWNIEPDREKAQKIKAILEYTLPSRKDQWVYDPFSNVWHFSLKSAGTET
jgi:hypothetical protein